MTIDWTSLDQQTASYSSLTSTTDPITGAVEVVFCGLQAKLSTIVASFPSTGGFSLLIHADTVIVDVPGFNATGTVLMARCLDISPLNGGAVQISLPASGMAVAEFLIGQTSGGAFNLTSPSAGASSYLVPTGVDPLQVFYYTLTGDAAPTTETRSNVADLQDLVSRAWALNSLKASYTAACTLMDSADPADVATAKSMFEWVVASVRVMGAGSAMPADYAELYSQAAALLVTLNVRPGATYVPVLSATLYQTRVNDLLNVLGSYEANINTLTTASDIGAAVASVSQTLQGVAQDEVAPLQAQLDSVTANISSLSGAIQALRQQYYLQSSEAGTQYALMRGAIQQENIDKYVEALFDTGLKVMALGVDVAGVTEGDLAALGEAIKDFGEAVKSAIAAIEALSATSGGNSDLLQQATILMQMQQALMISYQTGVVLWTQSGSSDAGADALPTALASVTVDPSLAWDNYLASAQAELSSIGHQIGSGAGSDAAQEAANNFLASLQILAGYGKAIDGKFVAYAAQLSQATVLQAQIVAAKNVQARWQAQQAAAQTNAEKLAALIGIIQGRADAIKRAIYVAWTYYRASYFFLYFQEPPNVISLDMNAAQLRDAFAGVSQWVMQVLGDASGGQAVRLPNRNVPIEFDFPIRSFGTGPAKSDMALLAPAGQGKQAVLSWTIPLGDGQLAGVLPNSGNVAIWITEASFEVVGAAPNSRNNLLVSVATSGTYQNGFGPQDGNTFVTNGIVGDFGYTVQPGQAPLTYIPWAVDPAVYMTPTPYTQWSMTFYPDGGDPTKATLLRVRLNVAYLAPPLSSIRAVA